MRRPAHVTLALTAYGKPTVKLHLRQTNQKGRAEVRRNSKRSTKTRESVTITAFAQTLSAWIGKELPRAALRELDAMCKTSLTKHTTPTPPNNPTNA